MSALDEDLTPEEREALARLPREAEPPPGLEDTTVSALVARGLLRRSGAAPAGRRRYRWILTAAAAVLCFAAGLALGRRDGAVSPPDPDRPRYLLLLYEGAEYRPPPASGEAARVREYAAWARTVRGAGEVVGGEKLTESADLVIGAGDDVLITPTARSEPRLVGFFLIRAKDQPSAVALARTCPHVRYGGSIVVREIDPT